MNKEILKAIKLLGSAAVLMNVASKLPEPPANIAVILMLSLPVMMVIIIVAMAAAEVASEASHETNVTNNYYFIADQKRSTQYVPDLNVIDVEGIEMK